jgi:hypothetical protein
MPPADSPVVVPGSRGLPLSRYTHFAVKDPWPAVKIISRVERRFIVILIGKFLEKHLLPASVSGVYSSGHNHRLSAVVP